MQGNARGTYKSGGKVPGERRGMQGNAREYRGMPGERMGVGAKCQGNAGECHSNVWEWCSAKGMQEMLGNARGTYGSGCKVPGECRGMQGNAREHMGVGAKCQGNAGECHSNVWEWCSARRTQEMLGNARGTYGSGHKVPGECRGMQGNAREHMGVGAKCHGNAWECAKCNGNVGGCQGNVWVWVQKPEKSRGMQGTGTYGIWYKVPGECK